MNKREQKDIWFGLHDFYLVETLRKQRPEQVILENLPLKAMAEWLTIIEILNAKKHSLSHQQIHATFIRASVKDKKMLAKLLKNMLGNFFSPKEIRALAKPILIDRFLLENKMI